MKQEFPTNTSMLLYFLKGSKRYFFFGIVFSLCWVVFDLINPKVIAFTVDSLLGSQPSQLPQIIQNYVDSLGGIDFLRSNLFYLGLLIVIIAVIATVFRFSFRLFNAMGAETLVKRMRDTLFDHILHLPFAWHSENRTGDIIQRCTSDVEQIKVFLSDQLIMLFRVSVLIIMALAFMFGIHPLLTLSSMVYIPVIMFYAFIFHKKIGSQFEKVDIEEGKLSSIAQENLTGVRVVRAFGRELYERERFEKQNKEYTNLWIRLMQLMGMYWSSCDLFSYAQVITVLSYGAYLCVHGQLTAGNYIAFISYNNMLIWPVRALGRVVANLSKAGISIERLRYIMNSPIEENEGLEDNVDFTKDINFEHVSYTYENGSAEILDDINFTIKGGTTVGILGGTGSGKSTLMLLLDKLYDLPNENGTISIGDLDIRDIKRSYLREHIGMVLQEPYLFSRSLSENIKIASQSADFEEVRGAAKIAHLDEAINQFKEGYDTFVGERGVTLSGGQKQRASIAQMLIRKPPIMIFDDSLSAVDAQTDVNIRQSLKENKSESTVILISHRITTLMDADQIIVMDKGRIAEMGSHEDLMKKNGIYRKIHDLQMEQGLEEEAVFA